MSFRPGGRCGDLGLVGDRDLLIARSIALLRLGGFDWCVRTWKRTAENVMIAISSLSLKLGLKSLSMSSW